VGDSCKALGLALADKCGNVYQIAKAPLAFPPTSHFRSWRFAVSPGHSTHCGYVIRFAGRSLYKEFSPLPLFAESVPGSPISGPVHRTPPLPIQPIPPATPNNFPKSTHPLYSFSYSFSGPGGTNLTPPISCGRELRPLLSCGSDKLRPPPCGAEKYEKTDSKRA
jgi:hypothetical protein